MPMAEGSLLVVDAQGRLVELPVGENGTVLGSDGTTPGYVTPSGGSGGLTHAYLGFNTIGASWETMPTNRVYAKPITLSTPGLIASVSAYLKNPASAQDDRVHSVGVGIYTDVGGTPGLIIGGVTNPQNSMLLDAQIGANGDDVGRWYHVALGLWLAAGDYWVAFQQQRSTAYMQIAYDASGADRIHDASGPWFADWGFHSPTTTSNAYSIRASVVR